MWGRLVDPCVRYMAPPVSEEGPTVLAAPGSWFWDNEGVLAVRGRPSLPRILGGDLAYATSAVLAGVLGLSGRFRVSGRDIWLPWLLRDVAERRGRCGPEEWPRNRVWCMSPFMPDKRVEGRMCPTKVVLWWTGAERRDVFFAAYHRYKYAEEDAYPVLRYEVWTTSQTLGVASVREPGSLRDSISALRGMIPV